MIRIINQTALFLMLFIISSCGASKEVKQNRELEKLALQVMEVHDRSMPHHGELFKLKKQMLNLYEQTVDSTIKKEINSFITDIDKADSDMMDWMHHYEAPADFLPFEEKKTYYIDQKNRIEAVELFMDNTISKSKSFIQSHSK